MSGDGDGLSLYTTIDSSAQSCYLFIASFFFERESLTLGLRSKPGGLGREVVYWQFGTTDCGSDAVEQMCYRKKRTNERTNGRFIGSIRDEPDLLSPSENSCF